MPIIRPSRRRFMQLAAGGVAGGVAGGLVSGLGAGFGARALAQPTAYSGDIPVRAIGRPMPGWVRWPEAPQGTPVEGSVGIAIIGLGGYGLNNAAPAILASPHCHVAALVSGNPDKARQVAEAYGLPEDAIYSYDTFDQIADDDRVDAVYVVLPTGLHADWTVKAFAAGKHVMCEKPMAISPAECQRMIDAGKAADRKLMIGYRCHFEPHNLRAMELMREDAVGPVRMIRTDQHYDIGNATPRDTWRLVSGLAGKSPLEDWGLYGLQASLYLSGEMPTHVAASAYAPPGETFSQIWGVVASTFAFPSGAIAQMSTSYTAANNDRVEVRGKEAIMLMDPATGYGGQNLYLAGEKLEPGDPSVQFVRMMDHFATAVRDGSEVKTGGAMGLRDMRLIDAIHTAAKEKRTIPLNPDGTMAG